ncbi:MAG: hypothetical protein WC326_12400 [Candidatus Delongbacteria bacterium]
MRLLTFLVLLLSLACGRASAAGDPTKPARLEFVYPGPGLMARLDGQNLTPVEGRCMTEVGAGRHLLEVYKQTGMFKADKVADTTVELPGAMITRITFKDGQLLVLDTIPVPGAVTPPTAAPAPQATTTTTTRTVRSQAPAEQVTLNMGMPGMGMGSVTMQVSGMNEGIVEETVTTTTSGLPEESDSPAVPLRPSKLTFLSAEGMCTVYLDGKKRAELPLSGIDEMATATIFDVQPGAYQLKVEGFEVWYEGVLQVGSGEEVKLRVEPQSFKLIGRNPL